MGKKSAKAPNYQLQAREQGIQDRQSALFNTGLNRVTQTGPTGSTSWTLRPGADPNNPQPGDYIQNTQLTGDQQALLDLREQMGLGAGGLAGQAAGNVRLGAPSTEGLAPLTGGIAPTTQATPGGYEASRRAVEQALMSRMEPGLAQSEERAKNELLQTGMERGTEGWNREMDRLSRARADAQMGAILGGGQEQSRLAGLDLAQQQQAYGQGMATSEADRQARMQGLTERFQLSQAPLDQYSQLYNMGLAGGPGGVSYPDYYGGGSTTAPDLMGAANNQYQAAANAANQRNAAIGQTASSAASLAMMYYLLGGSDRKLKHNLKPIGRHPAGVTRYTWEWADGSPGFGVIAQELQAVRPDAVIQGPGYLMVNYGAIGGF